MRRQSEVIDPREFAADVMFLSPDTSDSDHEKASLWYAHVIDIISANANLKDKRGFVSKPRV